MYAMRARPVLPCTLEPSCFQECVQFDVVHSTNFIPGDSSDDTPLSYIRYDWAERLPVSLGIFETASAMHIHLGKASHMSYEIFAS